MKKILLLIGFFTVNYANSQTVTTPTNCDSMVVRKEDRFTGAKEVKPKKLVIHKQNGMLASIDPMLKDDYPVIFLTLGKDVCMGVGDVIQFLFDDDSRHTEKNELPIRCNGSMLVFASREKFLAQPIKAFRVVTTTESYTFEVSKENSIKLFQQFQCIFNRTKQ